MCQNQKVSLFLDTMHPWSRNPCGRSLVTRLINHYIMAKDVQTAALLIAVFGNREEYTPRWVILFVT